MTATSDHRTAALLGCVLFLIAAALALTTDGGPTGPGIRRDIKGDEATYVAAALSAAYDGNLSFERRDLERFMGLYHVGPEGIFLKRGKRLGLRMGGGVPFVHLDKKEEVRRDRLYFGKALVYPIAAAPFVRALGLNGLLLLNVVLLAIAAVCGYLFLAANSSNLAALLFTAAFLGASVVPVYATFLMPEILNLTLVFVAYFLWLYKKVAPRPWLVGPLPEIAAAVLLGVAAYSKPLPNGLLIVPPVLLAWWRREWTRGIILGAVCVAVAGAGFAFTAAVSGEFNYQGGDRKTFYGSFPFDGTGNAWERTTVNVTTSGSEAVKVLTSRELPARFARNVKYFLIGRHFGFIPYFFPGAMAIILWLLTPARRDPWRALICLTCVVSAVVLLLVLPFTWSGGGGPLGNRYLLGVYPVLFFLIPPLQATWPAVAAWAGGALFTAKMLVNPFVAAKYPYLMTERGAARRLPVELTMANDLPVMLAGGPIRGRIPYGHDPTMLLYFLDQNAFPPEPEGMWVAGGRRTDIIVRSVDPIERLQVTAQSPVRTVLTVSMGASPVVVTLAPGKGVAFIVSASGVRGLQSYAYLLSARSSDAFIPRLQDPKSSDYRNLGALMQFSAVTRPPR